MRIEVQNLSFGYRDNNVLKDISFNVGEGDFLCVLGKNGAGKSTLFKLLLGFLKKRDGHILIEGKELESYSRKELAKRIAYIPQYSSTAFSYSVFDTVLMGTTCNLDGIGSPKSHEKRIATQALERFGISHLSHKSTANISGGERQLVLLARAIAQGSHILILDEPTANLDYGNQYKVMSIISKLKNQGYSIVLSTHNPENALSFSDKVLFIDDNKILDFGETDKVMTSNNLRKIYDLPIEILNINGKKICIPTSYSEDKLYV